MNSSVWKTSSSSSLEMPRLRMERSPLSMGVMVGSMWNSTPISLASRCTAFPLVALCFISTLLMETLTPSALRCWMACKRTAQRSGQLGDGVVNLGAVGIDADLHLLDAEALEPRRLFGPDHHRVGLQLDVEAQLAGVLQNLKAIAAQQRLSAADAEEEGSALGELADRVLDLVGAHLVLAFVVEIAMNAALVAAPGDVQMRAQRNALLRRLPVHLFEQTHGTSLLGNRMIRDN